MFVRLSFNKSYYWHLVVIFVIVAAAYFNTLSMNFVWDDVLYIRDNNREISLKDIPKIFLEDVDSATPNNDAVTPYYRPFFVLSLMIDKFFWNKNSFGYHFSNILLHLEVTLLIYLLLLKLFKSTKFAVSAAFLFAIHPVHSEAVAYISARTHLLCAFFYLLSFYLYLFWRERKSTIFLIASLFLFIFSMFSNEMGVTLPALILTYELCFENQKKEIWLNAGVYFLIAVLYVVLRFFLLKNHFWVTWSAGDRIFTGLTVIEKYIKILILPLGLKVFYEIPLQKTLFAWDVLISLSLLIFHIFLAFFFLKRSKPLFFGLAWIFLTLLPVSDIPAVIYPSLLAERYLYLPSVGFSIIFGASVVICSQFLKQKLSFADYQICKRVVYVLGSVVIVFFISLTICRNTPYKNDETLWQKAVQDAPESIYSHYRLAVAYEDENRLEAAKDEYEYVFQRTPQEIVKTRLLYIYKKIGLSEALFYYKLGVNYLKQGLYNSAEVYLLKSIKSENRAEAQNALGVVLEEKGMYADAVKHFKEAVRLNPFVEGYKTNLYQAMSYLKNQR